MREGWWWCDITEDEREPPDWDKIPEDRREMVRARWDAVAPTTKRWKLYGPQIPLYQKCDDISVTVIGPV